MNDLIMNLANGDILVGDGAMGTILFNNGLKSGDCPELMNLTHPELLKSIAREYADAGADLITTNSFGGSPLKLAEYGLDDRCGELNRSAVELAREGAGQGKFISGSVGPTGKMLMPYGETEPIPGSRRNPASHSSGRLRRQGRRWHGG